MKIDGINYFEFLLQFFSPKIFYYMGYAHLWFLLYLFVFSMIGMPLFNRWKNKPQQLERIVNFLCKGNRILLPMAFILLAEVILRPIFSGAFIIIGDWANDVVYLSSFVFGYVLASSGRIQEKVDQYFKISIFITLIFMAVLSYTFWVGAIDRVSSPYLAYIWVFSKGIYECAIIVLLLGLGRRFMNKKSAVLSYLNNASFTYYVFHFVPVSLFTYVFSKTNLNVHLKFLLTVLLSFVFITVIYEVFVRRIQIAVRTKTKNNH